MNADEVVRRKKINEMDIDTVVRALRICNQPKGHRCSVCPVFSRYEHRICKATVDRFAADMIESLQAQIAERDREIERLQNIISSPAVAYMSSPIGDLPIDSTGMRKAVDEIARLTEAQHWIPVTERLPTGCGYYLSVVERIAPDELGGNNTRVKIMRWLGADWQYPTHIPKWINEAITETVTHWMPLPAQPEEVEP